MDKPFPPWKYWTASSIRGTLHKVLTDLGEEVKENVAHIVEAHDLVEKVTKIDYLIKEDFTESALVVEFSLQDFQIEGRDLKGEVRKIQFDILQDVSRYLMTTKIKPHLKMAAVIRNREFGSVTQWDEIVKMSKNELIFQDWRKATSSGTEGI